MNLHGATRRFLQWFFRNRQTGAITIGQLPNTALWIFLVGTVLLWTWRPAGGIGDKWECLVQAALLVWAIDEVVRGVNPWRRSLGAVVLVYQVMAALG